MKNGFLVFILIAITRVAWAQDQHVIDSIMPLIKNDSSREDMEIYHELGFQYCYANHNLSLTYLSNAVKIANRLGDSVKILKINRLMGQLLRRVGRQREATQLLEAMLPLAIRLDDMREATYITTSLGVLYMFRGQYDKALEYNFRTLDLSEKEHMPESKASVLTNFGLIHYKVGNYDKAIEYYHKSLAIALPFKFKSILLMNYSNIGTANVLKGNFSEAKSWLLKSLNDCHPTCASEIEVVAEYGLGKAALESGNLSASKKHFDRSHLIALRSDDMRYQAENLIMLGKIEQMGGNLLLAEKMLINAMQISQDGDYQSLLATSYQKLFELYKASGSASKATLFLEKYIMLQDSLVSAEVRNKIMVAQAEFDDREHNSLLLQKQALLEKRETQTQLVVVICILVLVLAIGLGLLLRHKQRMNRMLDERIIERTRELEMNKAALERANLEQQELLARTSQTIRSMLATQKGMAALEDGDVIHLRQIEAELNHLDKKPI